MAITILAIAIPVAAVSLAAYLAIRETRRKRHP
jgi:hypothetical protein